MSVLGSIKTYHIWLNTFNMSKVSSIESTYGRIACVYVKASQMVSYKNNYFTFHILTQSVFFIDLCISVGCPYPSSYPFLLKFVLLSSVYNVLKFKFDTSSLIS